MPAPRNLTAMIAAFVLAIANLAHGLAYPQHNKNEQAAVWAPEDTQHPQGLSDPRELYPANFTLPNQTFPGLQRNFDIPPDCGETSYIGQGRLKGRRALITGGDSGIGRAIAIAFAREGADIVINYLPEEQPDADDVVSVILATTASRIYTLPGDLRSEAFCTSLVNEAAALLGGSLDILINNAGFASITADFANLTTSSFMQTIETNIFAPFFLTRAAIPHMPPGSSIVFTSSIVTAEPLYELADYTGTKAFLYSFAQALARGLLPQKGIKVNAVRPGAVQTNLLSLSSLSVEQLMETFAPVMPLTRVQQPVEVARQFVALVGNDASYVTGALH